MPAEGLIDPPASAREAGLHYVSDAEPGIRREAKGDAFQYIDEATGCVVADPETLARIRSLAVPPAWTSVWICRRENGHLQAVGRDARGRKQYRYHPRWREVRDAVKYERMLAFAKALPRIRRRARRDAGRRRLCREKVLATVVRLLELTLARVGNEEYARDNESFGLSTLRGRHVFVSGGSIRLRFRGKAGKRHSLRVADRRIASALRHLQELPGQRLFQYELPDGALREVESGDVNAYLREISGGYFTAKDFRTWAGTVLVAMALRETPRAASMTEAKRNVVAAIERAAVRLGNTPAICRKCYVHPEVIAAYLEGNLSRLLERHLPAPTEKSRLSFDEAAVLALLRRRLGGRRMRCGPDARR
jgi:DNA topoisomerase-1